MCYWWGREPHSAVNGLAVTQTEFCSPVLSLYRQGSQSDVCTSWSLRAPIQDMGPLMMGLNSQDCQEVHIVTHRSSHS